MRIGPITKDQAEAMYRAINFSDMIAAQRTIDEIRQGWLLDKHGTPADEGDIVSFYEPAGVNEHHIIASIESEKVYTRQIGSRETDAKSRGDFTKMATIKVLVPEHKTEAKQ
jgi:hypothetical protein